VGVKSDEILDPEVAELLVHDGGVQGLTAASLVLASLVKEGHDNIDPVGLAVDGGDHSLEILEMIVGRHVIGKAVHLICDGVIGDIHEDVDILASGGILKHSLAFAGGEAGQNDRKPVVLFIVSLISGVIPVFIVVAYTEVVDPSVYFLTELFRGRKNDQGKRRNGVACLLEFVV
jgi:hypothetical protein